MKRLLLFLLFSTFFLGCTGGQQIVPNGNNTTNITETSKYSSQEIVDYLQKHLVIYYGLWNVDIPAPVYSPGEWKTDVNIFTDQGGAILLRVIIDDETLVVNELWQRVYPVKEPAGIQTIEGKISCSENGVITVMEFSNPYCPNCITAEKTIQLFKGKFNESIDYEYRVMLPTSNNMIDVYGYENVSLTSKYYACVQNQSLLDQFRNCVVSEYIKESGKPLPENKLDSCAMDNNVSMDHLKNCLVEGDRLLNWDKQLGQTYLGSYAVLPTFVIDCRFKTSNPNLIRYAICYEFPETEGC